MSAWQKLRAAAWEGVKQSGSAAYDLVVAPLLSWEGALTLVGLTGQVVIPYVGQVVLVGLAGVAIYDLLKNVTRLFKLYYETAVGARSQADLKRAGTYFAQALLAGLLDVLAICGSPAIVARFRSLRTLGPLKLRSWTRFLTEQGQTLKRRLQGGGRIKLKTIDISPKPSALPAGKPGLPAPSTTKPPTTSKPPTTNPPTTSSTQLPAPTTTLPPVRTPPLKPDGVPTLPGLPIPTTPSENNPPAKVGSGQPSSQSPVGEVWDNRETVMEAVEEGHLPGSRGANLGDVRLSDEQMMALTEQYGIEFAQVYTPGKGPNGSGGSYTLYSGTVSDVNLPMGSDVVLINHTHPKGTPHPSVWDHEYIVALEKKGSPQKTSVILLPGKPPRRVIFDKDTPYMDKDGVLVDPKETK